MAVYSRAELFPDSLMQQIRQRFFYVDSDPDSSDRAFFDAASGSVRLKAMVEALAYEASIPDQMGRANTISTHVNQVVARGFEDVRKFLGVQSGTIMPAMSSTHAIYRVVNAVLATAPKGNVVTTELEHPSVYDSTRQFASRYGHQWRAARLDPDTGFVDPEAVLALVDGETRFVGLIHGSNMTGTCLDLRALVQEAKRLNPETLVLADGVQYAPHAPVDVAELGVDAYVFGPYKVFCVKGIGFAYLSERIASLNHWALAGKARDDWILGSADNATYAAWSAVVDYLVWLGGHFCASTDRRTRIVAGLNASDAHCRALLQRCLHGTPDRRGLMAMRHITVHAMTEDLSSRFCLILFNLAGMDSCQAVALYRQAGLRLHNRTRDAYSRHTLEALGLNEGIRLSASHANSPAEIDAFLTATEALGRLRAEDIAGIPAGPGKSGLGEG